MFLHHSVGVQLVIPAICDLVACLPPPPPSSPPPREAGGLENGGWSEQEGPSLSVGRSVVRGYVVTQ